MKYIYLLRKDYICIVKVIRQFRFVMLKSLVVLGSPLFFAIFMCEKILTNIFPSFAYGLSEG